METISRLLLNYIVNALWIVAVVAGVAWLCARFMRRTHARRIYLLWTASLGLSVLLPITGLLRVQNAHSFARINPGAATVEHAESIPAKVSGSIFWMSGTRRRQQLSVEPFLRTAVLGLYFTFFLYGAARVALSWKRTTSICRSAIAIDLPLKLLNAAEQCFRAFGVRPSTIAVSAQVSGPSMAGVRHTVLIVPEGFLAQISVKDFTSALSHELAHIRRRDFLSNLVCELLLLPICFHPAATFIKRRIDCNREIACDEMAAEASLTRTAYARSLLSLARKMLAGQETAAHNYALGLFDTDTLEERVVTLLNRKSISQTTERLLALAASALLATACALTSAFSLQVATPKADGGDIRPFVGTWEAKFNGKTFQTLKIQNENGKLAGTANHISIALDNDGNLIDARAHEGSDQITSAKVEGKVVRLTCTGKAHMNTDSGTADTETTQYEMKLTGNEEAEIRPIGDGVDATQLKPWKLERVKK